MKIGLRMKQKPVYDVKYLIAEFDPRYWEDTDVENPETGELEQEPEEFEKARISGKVDINDVAEKPHFCDKYAKGFIHWKIDLEEGRILDWNGLAANVYYKPCDCGLYTILDVDNNVIFESKSYVPGILSIDDQGYGDYLYITVDKDGYIKDWVCNERLVQDIYNNGSGHDMNNDDDDY